MQNANLYEVRSDQNMHYLQGMSPDGKFFFCNWNMKMFSESKPGHYHFIVNPGMGKALLTVTTEVTGVGNYISATNQWAFKYNGYEFYSSASNSFRKLDILQSVDIPENWVFTNSMSRRGCCLWKPGIRNPASRLEKMRDLGLIFREGPGYCLLGDYIKFIKKGSMKKKLYVELEPAAGKTAKLEKLLQPKREVPGPGAIVGIVRKTMVNNIPASPQEEQLTFNYIYRQLAMSFKTVPFIILAGLSGIGKSMLARIMGYQTCWDARLRHSVRPGNFELFKVKPDWLDSTEVFGYPSYLSGSLKFIITPFIRFMVKAWKYPEVPFMACLDEMNLARVEYYFAEYLSILETIRYHKGRMYSDPFISGEDVLRYSQSDNTFWEQLALEEEPLLKKQFLKLGITLPPNLVVIGTVNMDDTTHAFSRKVLDRSIVVEMNKVYLRKLLIAKDSDSWQYPDVFILQHLLKEKIHKTSEAALRNRAAADTIINELEAINDILTGTSFQFAYRTGAEILIYCIYNLELPSELPVSARLNICLDEMIMMKILPRIEGQESQCGKVIHQLLQKTGSRYPLSTAKLTRMFTRLNSTGYTSFWQ